MIDDLDFRFDVTREELEKRSADTISRLTKPISEALDTAKLSLVCSVISLLVSSSNFTFRQNDIESLIFVGGSSRVPMVQQAVAAFVGEDKIAKNVNADEAAVLGAGLYGAGVTRGFRTKDIRVQDLSLYAIDVAYQAENSKDGES